MSYDAIEAQIQTLLQGLTSVFVTTAQVTRGDARILDRGHDVMGILHHGPFDEGDALTSGSNEVTWTIYLDLIQRVKADGTTYTVLAQNRDAITQHIQKYPSLNGLSGIIAVGRMKGGDPGEIFARDSDSGPMFIFETITLPVTEVVTVAVAE